VNGWIGALIAVAAGVVVGQVAGRVVRRVLSNQRQPQAIREVAPSIGGFVLALCIAGGLITAVGIVSPEQLETMPRGLVNYLPKVIVAGIMLLLGNVAASVVGMVVSKSLAAAAGGPRPGPVRAIKAVVMGAAIILAVSQLGVDTTIVNLAVAALLFSAGATFTLLTAYGGRDVARNVAAGRYVRRVLPVGAELIAPVAGIVVKVHPATVELQTADGTTSHVPASSLMAGPLEFRRPD
jgi:hypothetical protein